MLSDLLTDEKMDLGNEKMIGTLLQRIDVERVRPVADAVLEIRDCVARLETRLDALSQNTPPAS
jgi:ubiquinone biosynthesis protein UbiJ